jgi:hypothetical protein
MPLAPVLRGVKIISRNACTVSANFLAGRYMRCSDQGPMEPTEPGRAQSGGESFVIREPG